MDYKPNLIPLEDRIVLDAAIAAVLIPAVSTVVHSADAAHSLYVDAHVAGGTHTGDSWANAYSDIQAALSRATAGPSWDIKVAAGTYIPAAHGGYTMANGVSVLLEGSFDPQSGNTANNLTSIIDGQFHNTASLLTVSGSSVVIEGFSFQNGVSTTATAGALTVLNHSSVLLINDSFIGNQNNSLGSTIEDGNGGAIFAENSDLFVSNSTFTNNYANTYAGGAISSLTLINDQTTHILAIDRSTFTGNFGFYGGGAVEIESSNTIVAIGNSQFLNNYTSDTFVGVLAGGAIDYIDYNSASHNNLFTNLSVTDSSFSGNHATQGGAIYVRNIAEVFVNNTDFNGNETSEGGGTIHAGGAINADSNGLLSITDSTFVSNNTTSWGGALYSSNNDLVSIDGSTFTNNSTNFEGGGLYLFKNGSVSIDNSAFTDNTAITSVFNSSVQGGAIMSLYNDLTITSSTFFGNMATGDGGAIMVENLGLPTDTNTIIDTSTFNGNIAGNNGGGISVQTFDSQDSFSSVQHPTTNVTINDSNFVNNIAQSGSGGALYVTHNNYIIAGHPLSAPSHDHLTVSSSTFTGNFAALSGGAIGSFSGGEIVITQSTFTNNSATVNGGAVASSITGRVDISFSYFDHNSVGLRGGALYIFGDESLSLTNNTFIGNAHSIIEAVYAAVGAPTDNASAIVYGNTFDLGGLSADTELALQYTVVNGVHDVGGSILSNLLATNTGLVSGEVLFWNYNPANTLFVDINNTSNQIQTGTDWVHAISDLQLVASLLGTPADWHIVFANGVYNMPFSLAYGPPTFTVTGGSVTLTGGYSGVYGSSVNSTIFTSSDRISQSGTIVAVNNSSDPSRLTNMTISNITFSGIRGLTFSSVVFPTISATGANLTLINDNFTNNQLWLGAVSAQNGGTLSLSGCTFNNNSSSGSFGQYNGAIVSAVGNQNVIVDDSTFTGNSGRGVIYAGNNDRLAVTNSTISDNVANDGGAIYSSFNGTTLISGDLFTNNLNSSGINGGAVLVIGGSRLAIENSTFTGNLTYFGSGGAIEARSGSFVTVNANTFISNSARGNGGAIDVNLNLSPDVQIANSVSITNNTFGGNYSLNGSGGALYAHGNGGLSVSNNSFSGNASALDGGAIDEGANGNITALANVFTNNSAGGKGGAIALSDESSMSLTSNTFSANSSSSGDAIFAFHATEMNILDNTFDTNNSAPGPELLLQYIVSNAVTINGLPSFDNRILSNLSAHNSGLPGSEISLMGFNPANLFYVDINNHSSLPQTGADGAHALSDLTFLNRLLAIPADWHVVFADGIYILPSTIQLTSGSITFEGGYNGVYGSPVNSTIFEGQNVGASGGIYITNSGDPSHLTSVTIKNITFTDFNTSAAAAVYATNANLTLIDSSFLGLSLGSAVFASAGGTISVSGSTFSNIVSTTSGAAIRAENNQSFIVASSSFSGNTSLNGGVITATNNASFSVNSSVFSGNTATSVGGAINANGNGSFTVNDCVFTENATSGAGGAISATNNGTFSVNNSTFANNSIGTDVTMYPDTTAFYGGAINAISNGAITFLGDTFTQNLVGYTTIETSSHRMITDTGIHNTDATAQDISEAAFGFVIDPNLTNTNDPSLQIIGSLNGSNNDVYRIFLRAGETVTADVDIGNLPNGITDTTLAMRNANGVQVAFSDDSPLDPGSSGLSNSFLIYTAGQSGFYFLDLAKFNSSVADGNYLLNVSINEGHIKASVIGDSHVISESGLHNTINTAQTINVSDFGAIVSPNLANPNDPAVQINGALTGNNHDFYRIYLRAGETITADVDNAGLSTPVSDTILTLSNTSGTQVAFNDDSAPDVGSVYTSGMYPGNSLLVYTAVTDGFYTLDLGKFDSFVPDGNYQFYISINEGHRANSRVINESASHSADSTAQIINVTDLAVATDPSLTNPAIPSLKINGTLTGNSHDVYRFFLQAGDTITADVDNAGLTTPIDDTILALRNGSGVQVAFNDDSDPDTGSVYTSAMYPGNSLLDYTTTRSGFYFLDLGKFDSSVSDGSYILNISIQHMNSTRVISESGVHNTIDTAQIINAANLAVTADPNLTNPSDPSLQITGALNGDNNDMYRIFLKAGAVITVDVDTATLSNPITDTILTLRDANGFQLAFNDDSAIDPGSSSPYNSLLVYTTTQSGFYFLDLAKYDHTVPDGNYLLNISVNQSHLINDNPTPIERFTPHGQGGAVFIEGGSVVIDNTTFTDNTSGDGGAVYTTRTPSLTVIDSTFRGNAAFFGRAVNAIGATSVTIHDNAFDQNSLATGSELNLQWILSANGLSAYDPVLFNNLTSHNTGLTSSEINLIGINPANTLYVDINNTSGVPQTGADSVHALSDLQLLGFLLETPVDWHVSFADGDYVLPSSFHLTGGTVIFEGGGASAYGNTVNGTFFDGQNIGIDGGIHVSNSSDSSHLADLTVSGITFHNFNGNSFAIYATGANLTLNNDSFVNNNLQGTYRPGADFINGVAVVSMLNGGNVVINSSAFNNNTSVGNGVAVQVMNSHSLTINNSSFNQNITQIFDQVSNRTGADDAGSKGGAVYAFNNTSVVINSSDFTNNTSLRGGAIGAIHNGSLTVNDSTFGFNTASSGYRPTILRPAQFGFGGGAIYSQSNGVTLLSGDTFSNNSGLGNVGLYFEGGGAVLVKDGSLTIENSDFSSNFSSSGGGAVSLRNGSFLTVNSTSFTDNTTNADLITAYGLPNGGGAIDAQYGGLISIDNSTFDGNVAVGPGGALNMRFNTLVSIDNSTFTGNSTFDRGGALYASNNTAVSIANSTFLGNLSRTDGGAIASLHTKELDVTFSTFNNNNSHVDGGAVFALGGLSSSFTHDTFNGNHSLIGGGSISANAISSVDIFDDTFNSDSASIGSELKLAYVITVNDLSYVDTGLLHSLTSGSRNSGLSTGEIYLLGINPGDTLYVDVNNSSSLTRSGSDWAHALSDMEVVGALLEIPVHWNVVFANGVYVMPAPIFITGGSVTLEGGNHGVYNSAVNSTVLEWDFLDSNGGINISNSSNPSQFTNLTASGITFHAILNVQIFDVLPHKGYVINATNANLTLLSDHFTNDPVHNNVGGVVVGAGAVLAQGGGSIVINNSTISNYQLGAVNALNNQNLTVNNSVFSSNTIQGAISAIGNGIFTVNNSTFLNNAANRGGAILAISNNGFAVNNSTFTNNTSTAIYAVSNGAVAFIGDTFTHNTGVNGGAVSLTLTAGAVTISNNTFDSNTASANGGAVYTANSSSVFIGNSVFKNNVTGLNGGAVYTYKTLGAVSINSDSFVGNSAQSTALSSNGVGGGGLFSDTSRSVSIQNSLFSHNTSNLFGGGIAVTGTTDTVAINNSQFISNTSRSSGGGLYASMNGSLLVSNSSFIGNGTLEGAGGNGGAIRADFNGSSSFTNLTFINNSAAGFGGAVAYRSASNDPGSLYTNNLFFQGNSAGYGGDFFRIGFGTLNILTFYTDSDNIIALKNIYADVGFLNQHGDENTQEHNGEKLSHHGKEASGPVNSARSAQIAAAHGGAVSAFRGVTGNTTVSTSTSSIADRGNVILVSALSTGFNTSVSSTAWGAIGLWIMVFDNSKALYVAATGLGNSAGSSSAVSGSTSTVAKGASATTGGLHLVYGNFVKWLSSVSKSIIKLTATLTHFLHLTGSDAAVVTDQTMEDVAVESSLSTSFLSVVVSNSVLHGQNIDISTSHPPVLDTTVNETVDALHQAHENLLGNNNTFCNGSLKIKSV